MPTIDHHSANMQNAIQLIADKVGTVTTVGLVSYRFYRDGLREGAAIAADVGAIVGLIFVIYRLYVTHLEARKLRGTKE